MIQLLKIRVTICMSLRVLFSFKNIRSDKVRDFVFIWGILMVVCFKP